MLKIYTDLTSLKKDLQAHKNALPENFIDQLVYTSQFADNKDVKHAAYKAIQECAQEHGVMLSSLQALYNARARGDMQGFTVPALNIRTLTYDIAATVFALMMKHAIGPVIFEIAVSEQRYTGQPPHEYSSAVLG